MAIARCSSCPVASPPTADARVLGRYALYDEIASGGMATVHIGRLLGPIGFSRTVAIKRLHPQYAKEPEFVSMFLDEARLAARIRHPNVVGTLDIVTLDGELFLVMEYVQGESLARLMRCVRDRGDHVPIPIAVAIIVGVLEGLHAAHEATDDQGDPLGIVHRDVSPQNVLVGSDGVPRVVDFGVAKAAGRVQNTRDGQLKGKLGYMAPEQINGIVTRATDVHAAAVVLWEMLTSRRLFHGDSDLKTFQNVFASNVAAPSTLAPGVTPALDAVVLRGLDANPSVRFASARDMARALQRATATATAPDVGDWVEALSGPNLSARARKIAAIESAGAPSSSRPGLPAAQDSAPLSVPALPSLPAPPSAARGVLDPDGSEEGIAVSRPPPRSKWPKVAAVLVGLATLGLGAAVGVHVSGSADKKAEALAGPMKPAPPDARLLGGPAFSATALSASVMPIAPPVVRSVSTWKSVAARDGGRTVRDGVEPQGRTAPAPAGAAPTLSDFSHVMDSRK